MKKLLNILLFAGLATFYSYCQHPTVIANPSFRYVATPGFVNISELNGGIGSCYCDPSVSAYYIGVTNLFGYQISRNFLGGIGIGYFQLENGFQLPLYLENRYSFYLKTITPYVFIEGGVLADPSDLIADSKVFLNPGIGVSRSVSPHLEINLSSGYMLQNKTPFSNVGFLNFKAGIIYRKNSFRMFKSNKIKTDVYK